MQLPLFTYWIDYPKCIDDKIYKNEYKIKYEKYSLIIFCSSLW